MASKQLLKPAEVAPMLGVHRTRVYQLIRDGVLPAVRIGGAYRIPAYALGEWMAGLNHLALRHCGMRRKRRTLDELPASDHEIEERAREILAEANRLEDELFARSETGEDADDDDDDEGARELDVMLWEDDEL